MSTLSSKVPLKTGLDANEPSLVQPSQSLDQIAEHAAAEGTLNSSSRSSINEDDKQMAAFGYKSQLARRWHTLESFAVSFCAM
ncbi:hypothetical protein QFC22_000672 [Naganishia vaughanmartiniae]|uniref:Uncharacterized protein n=1 Tax=Naganishia vaughanmartiniae TaxID=1424756 RepID=A0ACC2XKJ4_9TREE|nr:hypothetical protein QFC22_000672 [Naganishia vaughanmartiniae]